MFNFTVAWLCVFLLLPLLVVVAMVTVAMVFLTAFLLLPSCELVLDSAEQRATRQ